MNRYRTKTKEVTAIQFKQSMKIGDIVGMAGDWLIDDGKSQFFMTNEKFIETYEVIPQPAPITWPTNPFPDTYPGTTDHFHWPTNPQWPSGPIYWTSGPNFTQCSEVHTGSVEQIPTESHVSCLTIPKCLDGMPHNFPIKTGAGVSLCTKCGKTVSEALGAFAVSKK